jgi:hypothetical protein
MSTTYGATRWWEYYAVRYLMPSIAGVAIVNWLCSHANGGLRSLLSLPPAAERLDTASLTLLFLYGNLFCYVASYPVLVFHATRVLDFADDRWPARPLSDGYITALVLAVFAFLVTRIHQECRYWAAFLLASIFVVVQIRRLWLVLFPRVTVEGCSGVVSRSYGYSYALARRRGKSKQSETTTANNVSADFDDNEQVSTTHQIVWHRDYIDTYRHLREHGNSAFIFLLELVLAALIYCILTKSGKSAEQQLSAIGVLFAIWATPAVFVHLIGQHLERRFSHFDRRLARTADGKAIS